MLMQEVHKFSMNLDPNLNRQSFEDYIFKEGSQNEKVELEKVGKLF